MYKGCFNFTTGLTSDFSSLQIYLVSSSQYPIEIDDCIKICQSLNQNYTHMVYNGYKKCGKFKLHRFILLKMFN